MDASAARAVPGVIAVLTGADLEEVTVSVRSAAGAFIGGGGPMPEYTLLATDKVRFMGDPVAMWSPKAATWLRTVAS